jgi:hypothetical protein
MTSPMAMVKHKNKINNINKSESITTKVRPKIENQKINNLNINFNNVIFNAPLSNINQNINFNNDFISSTNENLEYKLLNRTNNNFNDTSTNNKSNNSNLINNLQGIKEKKIFISNLKNLSRNKIYPPGRSFSQNEDNNDSLINNNSKYGKILYEKNRINNQTYSNLYTNEKNDVFKKKKNDIIIPKPFNSKKASVKNGKKTTSQVKKTKKKIESRNKNFDGEYKGYGKTENFGFGDINKNINDSFKTKEDNKNFNSSKNLYNSPNSTGRLFTMQPINVNRNNNLISKKIVKTKQKIKLK